MTELPEDASGTRIQTLPFPSQSGQGKFAKPWQSLHTKNFEPVHKQQYRLPGWLSIHVSQDSLGGTNA
jgi:hypothetical protein